MMASAFFTVPGHAASVDEAGMVDSLYGETDAFRSRAGVSTVTPEQHLEGAARDFAQFMARTGRYGHEADGRSPAQRVRAQGYDYCIVSENIAYEYNSAGYTTPALAAAFANGWEHSPPHRRNLLDADVTDTGAAVARSGADGRYYAVQLFALPASRSTAFRIVNESGAPVRYRMAGRAYTLAPRSTGSHQRCRLVAVTFDAPRGQAATTIRPLRGETYMVTRAPSGAWAVTRRP